MDVSIIIINYNTKQMTSECINSVIEHTSRIDYEIILVDNASSDGSKEFFENDNRICYIYNNVNAGFGSANNIGMKAATGKYIFLLNSDTLLLNNAIKDFFDYAEKLNEPACYGCYLVDKAGILNAPAFYFPRFTIKDFLKDKFCHQDYCYNPNKAMEVQCVCGADMFFNKSIIDEVGGFDEAIFMYGEEGELQYRMKLQGIKRMLIPDPHIIHFGGGSQQNNTDSKPKFSKINKYKSHFYILKKHMNIFTYCLARIYYSSLILALYLPKALIKDKEYFTPIKQAFVRL